MTSSPAVSNTLIAPSTSPATNGSKRPVADESRTQDFQKTWQDIRSDQQADAADKSKRNADARDRRTSTERSQNKRSDLKTRQAVERKEENRVDRATAQKQTFDRQAQIKRDDIAAERSIRHEGKSHDAANSRKANDTSAAPSDQKNDSTEVAKVATSDQDVSVNTDDLKDSSVNAGSEKASSQESVDPAGITVLAVSSETATANPLTMLGFGEAAGESQLIANTSVSASAAALVDTLSGEAVTQNGASTAQAIAQTSGGAIAANAGEASNKSGVLTNLGNALGAVTSGISPSATALSADASTSESIWALADATDANAPNGKNVDTIASSKLNENVAAVDASGIDAKSAFEKMLQTVATGANNGNSSSGNHTNNSNGEPSPAQIGASSTATAESFARSLEAPAARSFVVQTAVPVNVGQPQWSQLVGDKVLWLAAQNVTSAEISLNPLDLGPMNVKVSVNQDQATVNFTSHHPIVREVLDQNLGRLREMFAEQGLHLNVDVSDRSFNRQQGEGKDQHGQPSGNSGTTEEEAPVAISTIIQQRLVDHYA